MTVAWAPVRPSEASLGRFRFAESAVEVLGQGAGLLRQRHPFLDVVIQGEIVGLKRYSDEDFDGRAVVFADVDEKPTALDVQFDAADHDEVVRAFRNNLQMRVQGDIHRRGRKYQLKKPANFVVLD